MLEQLDIWISDSVDFFALSVTIAAFYVRKYNSFFNRLFIYCLVLTILQLITQVMASYYVHNWYVYHIIGFVEMLFAFWLYRSIGLSKHWMFAFIPAVILYVIDSIWVAYRDFKMLEIDPEAEAYFVNNFGLALSMLFIVVLGVNFLWRTYLKGTVKNITKYPYFYVSAGLTFYGAGAFFTYLLSSNIVSLEVQDYVFHYSWIMVVVFAFIKFSLILIGLIFSKNGR